MKSYLIRPAGALVLALALASCGGGDDDKFTVQGTVKGLLYPGLILQNNGGQDLTLNPPANATELAKFAFPNKIEYGDVYNVSVKKQPDHQTCGPDPEFADGRTDTAGRLAAINVRLACTVNAYSIGGTITGLTEANKGLVLTNGSNTGTYTPTEDALKGNKPFRYDLPVLVPYAVTYGVTVLTQPTGRFCTVTNATGTMGDAKIENIDVNCVPV